MGKPTGFMEYPRTPDGTRTEKERLRDYNEFHTFQDDEERRRQGARCMSCGVPFCQSGEDFGGGFSGCPLHNLIPEWNDEVYRDNWQHALARLTKTNCFPEFTGRVCPALCEAACTCAKYGDAVTVRDNELAIIEHGFDRGYIKPCPPAVRSGKRVAVIGSGPCGLAVAYKLNRRGHNVTVFEKADRFGGLLMYGIPNMKLDKSVVERRVSLMKSEGVDFIASCDINEANAELLDGFDAVALCCGARKPRDLDVPERELSGVHFAVDYLTAATKSVLDGKPNRAEITAYGKNVVIVGGGDTGNDCVATAIRQGAKSVTQLEMLPCPPKCRAQDNPWPQWPRVQKTDYGQKEAIYKFGDDPRVYCTTVKELAGDGGVLTKCVTVEVKQTAENGRRVMSQVPGSEKTLPCDLLLIAAGFVGAEEYVTDALGLERTPRGTVECDADFRTNNAKVFVAGDARRGQSLVVWAIAEGGHCARAIDEYLMGYTNMTDV